MKNKETFDRVVGHLVKAYLNNTLEAHSCAACAVGNIFAGELGIRMINGREDGFEEIRRLFEETKPTWGGRYLTSISSGFAWFDDKNREFVHPGDYWESFYPYMRYVEEGCNGFLTDEGQEVFPYTAEQGVYIEDIFMTRIHEVNEENESARHNSSKEFKDSYYEGLMAVVDYLIEIHEGSDEECKQAKALFTHEQV